MEGLVLCQSATGKDPVIEVSALNVTFPWENIWRTRQLITVWHAHDATVTFHDAEGAVAFQSVTAKVRLEPGTVTIANIQFAHGAIFGGLSGKVLVREEPNVSSPPRTFTIDLSVVRAALATLDIQPSTGPFRVGGSFSADLRPAVPTWTADLSGSGKKLVWQDVPIEDASAQAQLSSGASKISLDLKLTKGGARLTGSSQDWDKAPLLFTGQIMDSAGRVDSLSGSHEGEPDVWKISSVRGSADLLEFFQNFPAFVPHLPTSFRFRTFPELELTDLICRQTKSGSEWTLEKLQFLKPADVELELKGKPLAISHLTGRAAYQEHTWQLIDLAGGTLGGRVELSGQFIDGEIRRAALSMNDVRMKALGPWITAENTAFADARFSMNYRGTLSAQASHLTGSGSVRFENAPVARIPLLDETYAIVNSIIPHVERKGVGDLKSTFTAKNGVLDVSEFSASSEALKVTGSGKVDLVRSRVDGRAEVKMHGVVGVVASPITDALQLKVSGPLKEIKVQPEGPLESIGGVAKGASRLPEKILKEGVRLPAHLLEMFTDEK